KDRIQFDFEFEGQRYRPTLKRIPNEGNLRRAQAQLDDIKARIAAGTFSFADEFPDFRFLGDVDVSARPLSCDEVFDDFLKHCESRMAKNDLAFVTVEGYRKMLKQVWRPAIGKEELLKIRYSRLVKVANDYKWKKKTYNNVISAVRCAFDYGYRDWPEKHNPGTALKCFRITKKDRPAVDPFTIQEAETLIAALHSDWGEAQGNYDEFRFFTGLRPSEQIALVVDDFDAAHRTLRVTKARVNGHDKDATKTGEDRRIVLCPRAIAVVRRQLVLRATLERAGRIDHDHLFFKASGKPIRNLQYPYTRWRQTLARLRDVRYR